MGDLGFEIWTETEYSLVRKGSKMLTWGGDWLWGLVRFRGTLVVDLVTAWWDVNYVIISVVGVRDWEFATTEVTVALCSPRVCTPLSSSKPCSCSILQPPSTIWGNFCDPSVPAPCHCNVVHTNTWTEWSSVVRIVRVWGATMCGPVEFLANVKDIQRIKWRSVSSSTRTTGSLESRSESVTKLRKTGSLVFQNFGTLNEDILLPNKLVILED